MKSFLFYFLFFNSESSYKDKGQWERKNGQSNHHLKKKKLKREREREREVVSNSIDPKI